jgi:hypothetical protein
MDIAKLNVFNKFTTCVNLLRAKKVVLNTVL